MFAELTVIGNRTLKPPSSGNPPPVEPAGHRAEDPVAEPENSQVRPGVARRNLLGWPSVGQFIPAIAARLGRRPQLGRQSLKIIALGMAAAIGRSVTDAQA